VAGSPVLAPIAAVIPLLLALGPAHGQQGPDALDPLLDRLVAEQDELALEDPDDLYSYYELGTFDPASFDQRSAIAAINADLPANPTLQCTFAAYPFGEASRMGIVRLLTGAGQVIEAARIEELPADRLVGAVMRSWEGFTGNVLDCNLSLARLYFDNGRVLTAYYDARQDLTATEPNVPSVVRLSPLEEFPSDRVAARPGAGAGGD
jgi:hypothetical protein